MRVKKIIVRTWIPGANMTVGGSTCAKLYRDARINNPNPYYEGLIQERGVKRGRVITPFTFQWKPIEPSDQEFLPIDNSLDNGRYGQINYAAISLPLPFSKAWYPIVEYTFYIDFKYLLNPTVPTLINTKSDDDEYAIEEQPIVNQLRNLSTIDRPSTTSNRSLVGVPIRR